jgi:hypothetical protein
MNQQLTPLFIMDNVYHRNQKLNVCFVPAIFFPAFYRLRQHILLGHRAATEGTRNSSVEIATWLRAGEVSKRGPIPGRGKSIFLWSKTPIRWVSIGLSEKEQPERKASAEVTNECSYGSTPFKSLRGVHTDKFTLMANHEAGKRRK